ncbi:MAG TPA: hypothetical protein VG291_00565 [Xanthobacteraceae bacterium]|nr:hypothetical protein [Xanthobacteraceae bacterium]
MNLPRQALLALCVALPCAPVGASAQQNQWDNPVDLKQLVPPVVPLPPNSRLNPGTVGGTQTPYTTAPLQNPNLSPSDPAPGIRLTIPAR